MNTQKIAVLGGGSWATAVVKILLNNVSSLHWWVREPEIYEGVTKFGHNPLYLSSVDLTSSHLHIRTQMKDVVKECDILVLVIPSAFVNISFQGMSPEDFSGKIICSAVKGIVPETHQVVAEYFKDIWKVSMQNFSVISGPSHAEEVAREKLTYLTSASVNSQLAISMAELFKCRYINTRISNDIFGLEYAAVLKNIYAISVGIAIGLGHGDNFISVLVANALQEMDAFLKNKQDIERNILTAPYLGDLLVTSYSQHSRNRTFGNYIGKGYAVKSAMMEMNMIAEGYYACKSIQKNIEERKLSMPIVEAVYNILYKDSPPSSIFKSLESIFK